MNRMKEIRIDKVTLNMGCGEAGPKLENAKKLLGKLTGKEIMVTRTHKRTAFGGAKRRPIGVKVTLRGEDAKAFLEKVIKSLENRIPETSFDSGGNLSIGVKEYINLPGIKYDPDIGIMGMDVAVTLTRPGFRTGKRAINPRRIGKSHRIKPQEAKDFIRKEFNADITGVKEEK